MAITTIGAGSSLAVKIFSAQLFKYSLGESFLFSRFMGQEFIRRGGKRAKALMGTSPEMPIQVLRDLERSAGDVISYDVFAELRGDGVYGDTLLEGKEKDLSWFTDEVRIDQVRQAVSAGGIMSMKRVKHDLRTIARDKLARWFARFFDEAMISYLAGTRGEGTAQWVLPTGWNGFAGNPIQLADPNHSFTIDAGGNVSQNPANATPIDLTWFDKLDTYISQMDTPINPIYIDGEPCYIVVLHPKAVEQLRTATATNSWLEVQKFAGLRGDKNPIFRDSLGKYGRFILHKFSKVPYRTIGTKSVAHNLVLGAQAGVVAFGNSGGNFSFQWKEEWYDYENQLNVAGASILGMKKIRFNNEDFGSVVMYSDIT